MSAVIVQSIMVIRPSDRPNERIAHFATFNVARVGDRPGMVDINQLEERVRAQERAMGWPKGRLTWMAWTEEHHGNV